MQKIFAFVSCFSIILFCSNLAFSQDKKIAETFQKQNDKMILNFSNSTDLQIILENAVNKTIKSLEPKEIRTENIAATVIDLSDPTNLNTANFRGNEKIYSASVVKMFYMVALFRQIADGKVKLTPELERGLKDMIEVSSNDATHYIFDILTETGGGAELSAKELEKYAYKRNVVNRYFQSLGYENINTNQKTYCEDIYGRERQFWNGGKQRNMLTTNATARLLTEIALGKAISSEKSKQMLELMKRDPFSPTDDKEDQAHGFTGISLVELGMKDAKLYSKAGWTSSTRHDAAYIETPDGLKLVIVVFTQNYANERNIIPGIVTNVLKDLQKR